MSIRAGARPGASSHPSTDPVTATAPSPVLAALSPGRRRLVLVAFWGNLLCQMGIIVTGGVVRLTGSGLGCSTWPNCEPGQFAPNTANPTGFRAFIEFGNRTLTGVLGVFAIAVLVLAILWLRGKGKGFLWTAVLPLIGTALQAIVGMIIVKLHLHPGAVAPHFLISIALVVVSTILLVRLLDGDEHARRAVARPVVALLLALAVIAAGVLVLGTLVTGSGPHSGDLEATVRLGIDPRTISWMHADAVMLFCGLLVGVLVTLHLVPCPRRARIAAWAVLAVTVLQALIGYTQYFTALPPVLVGMHMLGAALFTASVAWLVSGIVTWRAPEAARSGRVAPDAEDLA